jgi:phage/plasmid-associated DNA primase
VEYGVAFALAVAGDSSRSQTLTDDLARRFPEDTTVGFVYMPTLRALLALHHNEPSKTIELLQTAIPYELGNLKGKRLVTVNGSVGGNLNTSMLKLMSGGDALSAAKMRQDQTVFKPTHKVLLPTNERPNLPADPAFKGRVHMIPFLANFTGREDLNLDHVLQDVELPGILHRLITLCPDVIKNGLRPPASVLAETDQLFSELDVTKQFIDDCLDVADATTPATDMEKAVRDRLRGQMATGGIVVSITGHEDKTETKAETILRELKQQFKYVRLRKGGSGKSGEGNARVWAYVGVRLKPVHLSTLSTA